MLKRLLLPAAFLAAVAVAACGSGGDRDGHLKRGDDYLANNKVQEAIVEYRSAVQADVRYGPARTKLGEAYLLAKDPVKAFGELVRAADLMPDDMQAQLRAGAALLFVSHFDDARRRAELVLAKDPKNVDAHILKGNALAGLKDLAGAIGQIQEAIDSDPGRGLSHSNLGVLQLASGDVKQAEGTFKRAMIADPKSALPRLALANLYWSTNRRKEAEEELKAGVALDPSKVLPQKALAILYLSTKRPAEAEALLKAIAEKSVSDKLVLGDYYLSLQRLPEARAIYEQVAAGTEQVIPAQLRLASMGIAAGDRASAYKIIDGILAKEPGRSEALVAKAALQFQDGKAAEAVLTARAAVAAAPRTPSPYYLLGRILKAQGQIDEAESAFKSALNTAPQFSPANVELARIAIAAGKFGDAARYAQSAIDAAPGYGDAYLLLARAHVAGGNPAEAEAAIGTMVANFPNSPIVQAELGRLLLAKGDTTRAAVAFGKALAAEAVQVTAIEGMVALELHQKQSEAARRRLDRAVAAAPKNGELQVMAARMYALSFTDLAAAETTIKRAIDADSNNLAAFDLLARLYVQQNKLPQATVEFEKLARSQPKSVANHVAVGILNQLQGKLDPAKAAYERALAINPSSPVAANNLAQMHVDRNENLELALQLAQTAKKGLPDAHEVDDTMGWIYYRKGQADMAITSMKAAVSKQPDNPVYLYHLGAAYALKKDRSNARQNLEKALKLQPNFPGAEDAKAILKSIG